MKNKLLIALLALVVCSSVSANEIEYTSDGYIVRPNDSESFDANIISNTYKNGKRVIVFDRDITTIGGYAFYDCSGMTSVSIPESVTSIGDYAFINCSGLTSLAIASSVTSIGDGAFGDCVRLKSVTVKNNNPEDIAIGEDVFCNVATNTCVLYVPKRSKAHYAAADQWKDFARIKELTKP